jgi:hypothetical protein
MSDYVKMTVFRHLDEILPSHPIRVWMLILSSVNARIRRGAEFTRPRRNLIPAC